ncbi:hypothetical protein [Terriglobus sp. RCC_193]|uniref:hypothetical protein n=1 Tax=Terriglobus sp. RCC_193 TaxID=3239218 RepID=UPI0035259A83
MTIPEFHAKEAGAIGGDAGDHIFMSKLRMDDGNLAGAEEYLDQARAYARLAATHAFISRPELRDKELQAAA